MARYQGDGLGLLSEIVSNEETYSSQNKFSFADFEDDLDFINEHVDDEDGFVEKHDDGVLENNDFKISEPKKEEEKINGCLVDGEGENVQLVSNLTDNESSIPSFIAKREGSGSDKQDSDSESRKKVSFDLPDIIEYSDEFDSENEEGDEMVRIEEGKAKKASKKVELSSEDEGSISKSDSEINKPKSELCSCKNELTLTKNQKMDSILTCNNCNCRLTSLYVVDMPELNKLFSKLKIKGKKCKKSEHAPKCDPSCKKKGGKRCKDERSRSGPKKGDEKIETVKIRTRDRTPVKCFWDDSSDKSLLQWLKGKNKESKKKLSQERKLKRDEKRTKKLDEMDKMCRKEISNKRYDEWVKNKRKEERKARRLSRGKVSPAYDDDVRCSAMADGAPEGYTVLETFSRKSKCEIKRESDKKLNTSNLKQTFQKKNKQQRNIGKPSANVSLESSDLSNPESKGRMSYDDWLKSKRVNSAQASSKKDVLKQSEESKILSKEISRRHEEKEKSKHRVDTNLAQMSSVKRMKNKNEATKTSANNNTEEIELANRPDPPGCADPAVVLDGNKVIDTQSKQDVNSKTKRDSALVAFLSESKRPWIEDRHNLSAKQS